MWAIAGGSREVGCAEAEQGAPYDQLPPAEGDKGNDETAGEIAEPMRSSREGDRSTGHGAEQSDGGHGGEDEETLSWGEGRSEALGGGGSVFIPGHEPKGENHDSADAAEVLEEGVIGSPADNGQLYHPAEECPVVEDERAVVSEVIPEDVGGDSDEEGEDDEGEAAEAGAAEAAELEAAQIRREPALQGDGQKRGGGRFDGAMEEPEGNEAEWKAKAECAGDLVAPAAAGPQAEEVFEVGSEGAHYQGGEDEAGAAKRQGRGGMGEGEGHNSIMTLGGKWNTYWPGGECQEVNIGGGVGHGRLPIPP